MDFLMKSFTKPIVLVVACTLLPTTLSYPNGAPLAACASMAPLHYATSNQASPPPFEVKAFGDSYAPNQRISVLLSAPCGAMFGGFLLEGRRADSRRNTDEPIGTFNNPAKSKYIVGCGTSDQAVTHTNGTDLKREMFFEWTAPAQPSGHVVMAATFAINKTTYWVKVFSNVISDRSDNSSVDVRSNYPTRTSCDIPVTQPPATSGPQLPVLPLPSACSTTNACMSHCVGLSCDHYVMWSNGTGGVQFDLAALVARTTKTWMAIGFSDDREMGEDLVVECLSFGNEFRAYTSENTITPRLENVRTTRPMEMGVEMRNASLADGVFRCSIIISPDDMSYINMTREWYIMFASGNTASFRDTKLKHRTDPGTFPQVSPDMISFTNIFVGFPAAGTSTMSSGFLQLAVSTVFVLRAIVHIL